jgi:N-acetylneuraminate synthase
VTLGSVALGACVIEKHFTLSNKDKGPDHPHSMEAAAFKQMVKRTRDLEAALGTTRKFVVEEESETVIVQRRGLYARRNIDKGTLLTAEDIVELRPALGIRPNDKPIAIGKRAKGNIEAGAPLYWDNLE